MYSFIYLSMNIHVMFHRLEDILNMCAEYEIQLEQEKIQKQSSQSPSPANSRTASVTSYTDVLQGESTFTFKPEYHNHGKHALRSV